MRERDVGPATLTMLLIIDPEDAHHLNADGPAACGLLSPAELEVCDLLVRGAPTEGIAERRSTTLQTARDQIKAATAKLACNSRHDLVRLALTARPPIRDQLRRVPCVGHHRPIMRSENGSSGREGDRTCPSLAETPLRRNPP